MRRRAVAAIGVALLASVMLGGTALAASVDPVLVDGNPVCSGSGGPSGPSLGFDYGIKVDPPKEGTFALGSGTVTISDIDTSVNPATFTWSSSGVTVLAVIVKGGPNANVYYYNPPASTGDSGLHAPNGFSHINFCYDDAQMPGTLKVKKVVEGGPEGFTGTFPVTVDCGDGGTFTGDINYPNTGYRTFIDLPAGAECSVTEGTLPDAPDGYTWGAPSYTGNPATIKEDGKSYVTVTNTLTRIPPGDLRITKDISGGPGETTGSFDVTVDCGAGGTFVRTITFPDPGEVTIEDIPAGAVCTVDENIIQEDPPLGYHWAPPTIVGNPATIVSGQTVTIDVTNNIVPKPSSIKVIKDIPNVPEGFEGSFGIHVTCTGDVEFDRTITFPDPGSVTIDGIEVGSQCIVIETSRSDPPEGMQWGGQVITGPVTIEVGKTAEVTVTNLLAEEQGEPTLSIDVAQPVCDGNIPYLQYVVSVQNVEGNPTTVDITWINPNGDDVTYLDQPLSGKVLWPGAIPANQPGGPDWPNWTLVNGVWVEGDDGFGWVRPTVTVSFTVNPTNSTVVAYPESSPDCADPHQEVKGETSPPTGPPTDVLNTTEGTTGSGGMLLVLLGLFGVTAGVLTFAPVPASVRRRKR